MHTALCIIIERFHFLRITKEVELQLCQDLFVLGKIDL